MLFRDLIRAEVAQIVSYNLSGVGRWMLLWRFARFRVDADFMTGGVSNGLVRLAFSEPSCFVELCNKVLAPSDCLMRQECLKFATLYVPSA